jgi:glycosyltransferase involved in cell wall biosynthesis
MGLTLTCSKNMPKVAIGVPIQTGPDRLRATLDSLRLNTLLPFSLLLLPDGPDDATRDLLSALDTPQLTADKCRGGAACLNRLAKNTDAEVIVLLESGSVVGPGWLDYLLAAFDFNANCGLAGPSTNRSWNEQCVFPQAGASLGDVARTAAQAFSRFGSKFRTLAPLYSLADFCYVVRREVFNAIGEADESYGVGPCWEMDYNIRAARAGFQGLWACASYVYRSPAPPRRLREEELHFEASKHRYQDKFCGARLRGEKKDYRSHCRGDACKNFAPLTLVLPHLRPETHLVRITPQSTTPLVSCIMPTCNRRSFINRAIQCFQRQDYANSELIIIDNGTDPIRDLLPDDPRVRYSYVPQKLTIGALRNLACRSAGGEIIVHWDDDDWYPAHRIRVQTLPLIESRSDITGTSCLYYYDASTRRAFLYRYAGAKTWVSGNTLAYKRVVWQRSPFLDIQVGEDSAFVWNAGRAMLLDLKDPSLCIASIHPANASPKHTRGAFWVPQAAADVLALVGEADMVPPSGKVPLVSCVMPTFNRRPFIPLALRSFRAQTYRNKELVVVDDGTDPVGELFREQSDVRYIRVPQRLTIGAKRNLGCHEAHGEIIAQWDDDDWYSPDRIALQVAPILAGDAEITGIANRFMLEVPAGRFWAPAGDLHRRMFVGDVHGGSLVYRKNILADNIRYPETNLAEDASLLQQAIRRKKRLLRLENEDLFVYLRHNRNAWKFEVGQFISPKDWNRTSAPPGFSNEVLDLYRCAAAMLA